MVKLEDLQAGVRVRGLITDGVVTIKAYSWFGDHGVEVLFKDTAGNYGQRVVFRDDEPSIELVNAGKPWSFDGDGALLRLVSEAYRIRLAYLFDPYLAITTSQVEPFPHQISAVYEEMLPRQPMRFLLADDPGAGKTIMAGLLIRELIVRGDLERCLIIAPGSLTEQWQDELFDKFGLEFDLLTREMIRASRTANPFDDKDLLIARLDQLSRNEDLQERLKAAREWDLVVCDEAHRMSAHFVGGEVEPTKRYKLGQVVGDVKRCRNFLLMTATPHNGKEEDFQLFLALLDGDRFEGRFREGVHVADPSDLMRRMIKEDLKRFDGTDLFPERRSHTAQYPLSDQEAALYHLVTEYVREEMNRAERFAEEGEGQRRVNVAFALMTLQRRLASSPEAIYQSLMRRRERLESRLRDERLQLRGQTLLEGLHAEAVQLPLTEDDWDDLYEEAPQDEREEAEAQVVDLATAARTIEELEAEIETLKMLEERARRVLRSAQDAKWNQLNSILDDPLMVDAQGNRRKLVIFTEFRDTLCYLADKIRLRLGRGEAVVEIHGGVPREDRRKVVNAFMNDPTVLVLVANDAAGEGVNLQRAHLMVNYDLPWNPNRLEQRFGRIHRIGQTEVCHLWNLVAKDTREGDVYLRLLDKLEAERRSLGGKVFDVLGQLFEGRALRDLLVEAIRAGQDAAVKTRLEQAVDAATEHDHILSVWNQRALVRDSMDTSKIEEIKEERARAHASRLQPNYIQAFFHEAFRRLGGKLHRREKGRFEITHVPAAVRDRDRLVGVGAPVLDRYERVCFDKDVVGAQPRAHLICPGTPLLDSTIDLVLERHGELLKRGAVLVDERDEGDRPRLLFYLEHAIQDGRRLRSGERQVVSRRLLFVEGGADGEFRDAGAAPYLDYRPATEAELACLTPPAPLSLEGRGGSRRPAPLSLEGRGGSRRPAPLSLEGRGGSRRPAPPLSPRERGLGGEAFEGEWLCRDWEDEVRQYALREVVPRHLRAVKTRRMPLLYRVEQEVKARLQKEINYWDHRTQDLKAQEQAGKKTRLPAGEAEKRANKLSDRLQRRLAEIERERHITARPPEVRGGSLVVPIGLLRELRGEPAPDEDHPDAEARKRIELLAMDAVMKTERALGREPRDVSDQGGLGYDIESKDPETGLFYFIEVKGRIAGADHVTLRRSEVLCALNEPDRFRLAVVVVEDGKPRDPVYVRDYDFGQPGFAQTSSSYTLKSLLDHGGPPT